MPVYRSEGAAADIRRAISNLSLVKDALAKGGLFQGLTALRAEDQDVILGSVSGTVLTNFQNAMAAQQAVVNAIGAAVASASGNLSASLQALEI
jgi:hypothetical protein